MVLMLPMPMLRSALSMLRVARSMFRKARPHIWRLHESRIGLPESHVVDAEIELHMAPYIVMHISAYLLLGLLDFVDQVVRVQLAVGPITHVPIDPGEDDIVDARLVEPLRHLALDVSSSQRRLHNGIVEVRPCLFRSSEARPRDVGDTQLQGHMEDPVHVVGVRAPNAARVLRVRQREARIERLPRIAIRGVNPRLQPDAVLGHDLHAMRGPQVAGLLREVARRHVEAELRLQCVVVAPIGPDLLIRRLAQVRADEGADNALEPRAHLRPEVPLAPGCRDLAQDALRVDDRAHREKMRPFGVLSRRKHQGRLVDRCVDTDTMTLAAFFNATVQVVL
mmetsp:Transcript_22356/g.64216  ORF Transcript_22356/g.64216 Transcript_22356/m.64216 type:complete len:337 (+) Transcript_22356:423-1433(+)